MTQEQMLVLLKDLKNLKASNLELADRCRALSKQIAEMKEKYDQIIIDIKILKEGGNI